MGITHPVGGQVTFWNIKSKTFVKNFAVASPQGIALSNDGNHFLVTTAQQGLMAFSAKTLEIESSFFGDIKGLNWRHAQNGIYS